MGALATVVSHLVAVLGAFGALWAHAQRNTTGCRRAIDLDATDRVRRDRSICREPVREWHQSAPHSGGACSLVRHFRSTANNEAGLPAIIWRRIPFRQEGDKLTGLYAFRDSFGYQDSVIFSGSLIGGSARVGVTAVRKDGSSNFTVDMTGSPASMTGQMRSGTSQHPVRSCSLALTATR